MIKKIKKDLLENWYYRFIRIPNRSLATPGSRYFFIYTKVTSDHVIESTREHPLFSTEFFENCSSTEFLKNWFSTKFLENYFSTKFCENWFSTEFLENYFSTEFFVNWFPAEFFENYFSTKLLENYFSTEFFEHCCSTKYFIFQSILGKMGLCFNFFSF